MTRTYSISEIREEITRLPEQLEREQQPVTVTRRGQPVMTILTTRQYQELLEKIEALQETLEIIQDEEMMAAFREGVKALQEGKTVAWDDAKRELGLA
ncbi:MAG TPA: type II toxin-antitoxin system Phd/YefM family antitoxin [Ktedonobacteraceae bacterium]|jgi:prevent-host-death family protein|nr:type II toxin-antitoxin system Phd/YefM family antitoxin [Ktedonobacteraceae bacterium]